MFCLYSYSRIKQHNWRILNSASNFEISIGKTVELISELMNKNIEIRSDNERIRPKESEVNRLFGSNKKILSLTEWAPIYQGLNGFKKA